MGKIDRNQILLPIFFLLCITTSVLPIWLSWDLIQVDNYERLLALLDKPYIHSSYFVSVIMQNLDYLNFSLGQVVASLVKGLSVLNIVIIIYVGYLWAASHETIMKAYNKGWMSIIYLYLVAYLSISSIIIVGFKGGSVNEVIVLFNYVGYIMLIAHLIICCIGVWYLWKTLQKEIYPIIKNKALSSID